MPYPTQKQIGEMMGQAKGDLYSGGEAWKRWKSNIPHASSSPSTLPKLPPLPKMFRFFIRNPVFKKFMEAYRKFASEYQRLIDQEELQKQREELEMEEWKKKIGEFDKMKVPYKPDLDLDVDMIPPGKSPYGPPDSTIPFYPDAKDPDWSYQAPDDNGVGDAPSGAGENELSESLMSKIRKLDEAHKAKAERQTMKLDAEVLHPDWKKPLVDYDY